MKLFCILAALAVGIAAVSAGHYGAGVQAGLHQRGALVGNLGDASFGGAGLAGATAISNSNAIAESLGGSATADASASAIAESAGILGGAGLAGATAISNSNAIAQSLGGSEAAGIYGDGNIGAGLGGNIGAGLGGSIGGVDGQIGGQGSYGR
ncbi:uncharacterized protein LOC133333340 [Musca vetustissima]|uniref:uncharacterized protein LOC133333340 n=1 Tax=Musca vetustissima TaxID=27455 RepID=UPI002AB7D35C|nr:uncharacterized protein LOC133333340 [Musca vetustissima]